ncbi:four helix bundle protein [Mucilaginibacter sp. KACC 22063]|uniref:four helix bundle protein n=1 Tax=Mucilaginibacter sp. KACC 22063 TaxID=3025666 RepID=UPI0023652AFC|nr:four helix bundle protein [Mucilaginibacter sp. KACC 22063]WDF54062.1 four helix bundle protein [Mucilaginibacter sp. KACC 22063]
MNQFRFQNLEIWQLSINIGNQLCDIADLLETKKKYRFAEQLNGAALSISNNIAEGSGASSKKEFCRFLDYAHRSVFENANILHLLHLRQFISNEQLVYFLEELNKLARKINSFQKYLSKED